MTTYEGFEFIYQNHRSELDCLKNRISSLEAERDEMKGEAIFEHDRAESAESSLVVRDLIIAGLESSLAEANEQRASMVELLRRVSAWDGEEDYPLPDVDAFLALLESKSSAGKRANELNSPEKRGRGGGTLAPKAEDTLSEKK